MRFAKRAEIPNPKHQIPNSQRASANWLEIGEFKLFWSLELGAWNFTFLSCSSKRCGVAVKWVNRLFNKNTALC